MTGAILEIAVYMGAAAIAGIGIGWLVCAAFGRRRITGLTDEWQLELDRVSRQRDRLTNETASLRSRIEEQEGKLHQGEVAVARFRTELESAREKEKRLTKDVFTLKGEREEFKGKVSTFQNALVSVKQQAAELQSEFIKSREFYKNELQKSFEKRKDVEAKLENVQAEQDSVSNLLSSSRSEHDSVNRMLQSAQARLADLEQLEHKVIKLEAENAQLSHDARLAQQEIEVLKRDVGELEELKVQNKELAHCLQSMESSRKQYEDDANRYRERADDSEKKSETLKLRLDEVEQNFLEIEKQQEVALKEARRSAIADAANDQGPEIQEVDDLQEIVGIGKVFEKALHDLGVYSFRQIANFGPSDIARVNRELKECRGRLEQDDWIGQAKDLYFKKYGTDEL